MAKTSTNKAATASSKTVESERKSGTLKKTSNSDAKGRVVLGPQFANKMFRVSEQADGNILLEPVVTIHEREVWFYKNPEVQAMVQEGVRQSREGKGKYLGSFAEFTSIDSDDED